MSTLVMWIICVGIAAASLLASRVLMHYFQLESYQFAGYFRTLRRNWQRALLPGVIMAGYLTLLLLIHRSIDRFMDEGSLLRLPLVLAGLVLALAGGWWCRSLLQVKKAKKPFVVTMRVKRTYIVSLIVFTLLLALAGSLITGRSGPELVLHQTVGDEIVDTVVPQDEALYALLEGKDGSVASLNEEELAALAPHLTGVLISFTLSREVPRLYMLGLFPLLMPLWIALGGLCAWPVEKLVSEMYFRDAQRKLAARRDLIKIGITGSYGKTSVKFIMKTILEEKFQVLATPSSFNTPMGVTRIIRERLQPAHQVFIAEMGARHVGDIKELCRLVHPLHGVLTSVGPQHLDTFRTLERIKKTKYELMDAIPEGGCCFFPDDGAICRELFDKTMKEKRLCTLSDESDEADVWASDVTVSPSGSAFTLHTISESIRCETRLLGEHNIQNILLAATVGLHLGMNLRQVARGISRIMPVEHRLQLIPSTGVTIIDDAFNSNPNGAKAALKVIRDFPGRRIIITPGMVELGEGEDEFNHDFGVFMSQCVDVAILVGKKHTAPIARGLKESGFPEGNLHVVSSLEEAATLLREIGRAGDVALFENDLPDNYSEN